MDNLKNVNKIDKSKKLNHREQAREKMPIFYGSRDNHIHGFRETVNNSVDEILNNFNFGTIDVTLHDDLETITIKDSGRGIPVQIIEDGVPFYEIIFETMFAGCKMEDTDSANSGLNGIGLTVLNYTSEIFNVEVCSLGHVYRIHYENGGMIKMPLTKVEKKDDHYTQITFKLDKDMYAKTEYSYEALKNIMDITAKVSPNLTLSLTYDNQTEEFHYDSLEDYFEKFSKENVIKKIVGYDKQYKNDGGEETDVKIVFAGSTSEELLQECMLNGNNFILSSTISEGIVTGAKSFAHKYARENKLYVLKEKNINNKDIEDTFNFVCNIFSNRPEFEGQTKFSTKKELYKKIVSEYIQEILEVFSKEREDDCNRLVEQILISKRASEKSDKLVRATKKKLTESVDSMHSRVEGLSDCKYHTEDSEFFIAEGKSAMGSLMPARNPRIQAGYGIRGKILSCLKANYETIFANKIVIDLIKILGCGVEVNSKHNKELSNFDISKLRYGKIVLATDSDFDGLSIQVLLLTMFYRLMPQLIYEGKIYIAQPPKYIIRNNGKKHYATNDEERDELLKKLEGKTVVGYQKGLGEMNQEDLHCTTLNPDTRQMIKVTIGSVEKMIEEFEEWMGEDVTIRKKYIEEHLHEYINDEE